MCMLRQLFNSSDVLFSTVAMRDDEPDNGGSGSGSGSGSGGSGEGGGGQGGNG